MTDKLSVINLTYGRIFKIHEEGREGNLAIIVATKEQQIHRLHFRLQRLQITSYWSFSILQRESNLKGHPSSTQFQIREMGRNTNEAELLLEGPTHEVPHEHDFHIQDPVKPFKETHARRSPRLLEKRIGIYKSPEARVREICYPMEASPFKMTHSAKTLASFSLKNRKAPVDADTARQIILATGAACTETLKEKLEMAIKQAQHGKKVTSDIGPIRTSTSPNLQNG